MADLKKATDTTFTDLGVDSRTSIQMVAYSQRATAIELPAAFFTNFATPAAVEELGMPKQLKAFGDLVRKSKGTSRDPPNVWSMKRSPGPERPSKQLFGIVAEALGLNDIAFTPSPTFESLGMDTASFAEHATVAAAQKELDAPFEALTQSLLPVKTSQIAIIRQKEQPASPLS
ncbi:MAG: hypothetical protein Q9184_004266 [Pyrenodesmia sp. 2 TL-2023]